jgi:hypothetical protein
VSVVDGAAGMEQRMEQQRLRLLAAQDLDIVQTKEPAPLTGRVDVVG